MQVREVGRQIVCEQVISNPADGKELETMEMS